MDAQEPTEANRRSTWLLIPFACLPLVAVLSKAAGAMIIVPVYFLISFVAFVKACRDCNRPGELWWILLLAWIGWGIVIVAAMATAYCLFGWSFDSALSDAVPNEFAK